MGGQFHQHILAAFFSKTRWDPFLGKWRLANSKLIWQISPYILGKFHQHRMLVKSNGECFAECCFPATFRTKVSEIDPWWHDAADNHIYTLLHLDNDELLTWSLRHLFFGYGYSRFKALCVVVLSDSKKQWYLTDKLLHHNFCRNKWNYCIQIVFKNINK